MIRVNMSVLFEERIVEYEQMILTKQKLLTQNRGRDQPVKRLRLSRSMVWNKFQFLAVNEKEIQKSMQTADEKTDSHFEITKKIEEEEEEEEKSQFKSQSSVPPARGFTNFLSSIFTHQFTQRNLIDMQSSESLDFDNQIKQFEFKSEIDDKDLDDLFDDTVTLEERISRNRAYTRSKRPLVRRIQSKMSSDLASLFKQRL